MAGNPAWKDGKSGNPGGRPKRPPEEMEKWRKAAEKNLDILIEIRDNPGTKESDRIRAIEMIEDRTYGKPVQSVETKIEDLTPRTVNTSELTQAQMDALASLPDA